MLNKSLPQNLLFGQREKLPQNASAINWNPTPNTSEANPDVRQLTVYGSSLKGIAILADFTVYTRITDGQNQIFPVSGYFRGSNYCPFIPLERDLIGPPWVLTIYSYNTDIGASIVNVIAVVGDRRETDTDYLILQELRELNSKFGGEKERE
jgi:hypothetical protein